MASPVYDLQEQSIREIILDRLNELGVSKYALALSEPLTVVREGRGRKSKIVSGMSKTTTFRFLSGECDTMVANVEQILRALDLTIAPVKKHAMPDWLKD